MASGRVSSPARSPTIATPRMRSLPGTVSTSTCSMPGMGGTKGRAPAAKTMLRVVSRCTRPSGYVMSTSQGETMRAVRSATSTPSPV